MCQCLVIPSTLLTKRAHMSPHHDVVWQGRFVPRPNVQPSVKAALISVSAHPRRNALVRSLAPTPHPSCCWFFPTPRIPVSHCLPLTPAHTTVRKWCSSPTCWGHWDICVPIPVPSPLWEERHNLQVLLLKKQGKKASLKH